MDQPLTDRELLADFANRRDEGAYAEFVRRHFNLVYSAALRVLNGDRHLAEDVAQQVFFDASRKASRLSTHENAAGWLFRSARYAASKLARSRARQSKREQTAAIMTKIDHSDDESQSLESELQPMLDEALNKLPLKDQDAILLRFYAQLDYRSIGARLNLTANAVRMRIDRALRKLETTLSKQGIPSTTLAIGAALESDALVSAPAGLSSSVATNVLNSISTSSIANAAALSGAKWPLIATFAIVATGMYIESSLPERTDEPNPAAARKGASGSEPALPTVRIVLPVEPDPSELDEVERAYAALDRDATLLSNRLDQINRQLTRNLGKAPEGARIYQIRDLDKPPRAQSSKSPIYPLALHGAEIAGEVVVEYTIDEQGVLLDPKVLGASHPEFAISVLENMPEWEFTPGEIAEQAVPTRVRQVIKFQPSTEEPSFDWWF